MSNFAQIQAIATSVEVQLRWSDQDINDHINNARILTLIEEARIRATQLWMATTPGKSGTQRVVRALNTNFDKQVQYGPDTTVWVWVPRIGNSSFVFGQLLVQDGVPCVYTEATMVVIHPETGNPIPHDAAYRKELEAHTGPAYSTR